MKHIYVLGDSWMTPSPEAPNTHFSELLVQKLAADLTVFARGGMSNGGIAIQIESAIAAAPDLILVNTTLADRIEIALHPQGDTNWGEGQVSVRDIVYRHPQSVSSYSPHFNQYPKLISDTIHALLPDYPFPLYEKYVPDHSQRQQAVKTYFTQLYDHNWKTKQDQLILYAALHKLHVSEIPYILLLDEQHMNKHCDWLNQTNYIDNKRSFEKTSRRNTNEYREAASGSAEILRDPGYHTLPQDQVTLADTIYEHILKYQLM